MKFWFRSSKIPVEKKQRDALSFEFIFTKTFQKSNSFCQYLALLKSFYMSHCDLITFITGEIEEND